MPTSPQYLSTSQAAERLGLSREHVRRLIQRGELHADETVNGFMLPTDEVEQYAIQRRILQGQRQFRAAVDDLAAQARYIDEATGIRSAIAQMRDQMKLHSAFDVPAVPPQWRWIEQQVATQKTLTALAGPVATVAEKLAGWQEELRRRDEWEAELRRRENIAAGSSMSGPTIYGNHFVALARKDDPLATAAFTKSPMEAAPRPPEMARGFVVAEPREARLEEKVDQLSRKVEQLTELVIQQRADTTAETPTWQQWAGSDRPEDVLAKLAAVREKVTGEKRAGENSTDVIREAREARGGDA